MTIGWVVFSVYIYAYVEALPRVHYVKQSMNPATEMLIKHEAKPSVLLASRPRAECFISRNA